MQTKLPDNSIKVYCSYYNTITEIHDQEFSVMHLHKSDQRGAVFIAKDVADKFDIQKCCKLLTYLLISYLLLTGYHFNLPDHSISDMSVLGIESLGHHSNAVRLSREKMWMKRLRTIQPHGLNIQEGND